MEKIKEAAVAGLFYPSNPVQLSEMLDQFIEEKSERQNDNKQKPVAMISPHAGYVYSGSVAGKAYAMLRPYAEDIKKVAILAPAHTVPLHGMALSSAKKFETPLGQIIVNHEMDELFTIEMGAKKHDMAFEREHAIEVQLPFLQKVLPDFSLLPIVVGQTEAGLVERVIAHLISNRYFVIVSTDLTHFLPYQEAQLEDQKTCELIEKKIWSRLQPDHACGHYSLKGMMKWCQDQKKNVKTIELLNSGDTAGDKSKVVGYGAWLIY